MIEDLHNAALRVDALLSAIPAASEWDRVRMSDELFDVMVALDAIPPEIEAAISRTLGQGRTATNL